MAKTYQKTKLQEVTIKGYKSIAFNRPVTLKLNVDPLILSAIKEDITSEDVSTNCVMPQAQLDKLI
jgi:hypothetical protein